MTAIEMKYTLFRDIDSINDESVLRRLSIFVKSLLMPNGDQEQSDADDAGDDGIDYDFGGMDFGYAKTIDELKTALEKAEAERNDPTKWITSEEFHQRLEQKYPWLR